MAIRSIFSFIGKKLTFKIAVYYTLSSILAFSALAFLISTNQLQMLTVNAQFESDKLIYRIHQEILNNPQEEQFLAVVEQYVGQATLLNEKGEALLMLGDKEYSSEELIEGIIKAKLFKSAENRPFFSKLDVEASEIQYFIPLPSGQYLFIPLYLKQIGTELKSTLGLLGVAIGIAIFFNLFIGLIINNMVIKPIIILQKLTKKVTQGDYVHFRDIRRQDEIGQIAHSFNLMSDTLKVNQNKLSLKYQQAKLQANTDPLTGAYNRRALEDKLRSDLLFCNESNQSISLVMMDIDFFKKVNDTYGHESGDICLKQFVQAISSQIKEEDFLARFGGEEFVLLFHEITALETQKIVERIRQHIESQVIQGDQAEFKITASFGISDSTMIHKILKEEKKVDKQVLELLRYADNALYKAKKNGRNQSVVYA